MKNSSKPCIAKRLEKFRKMLGREGLDAALIVSRPNYIYLSGFNGTSAYLLITRSEAYLVTDFRYVEQAQNQAGEYTVVKYAGKPLQPLKELCANCGIRNLGFEEAHVTYESYIEYSKQFSKMSLAPVGKTVERLRTVKDSWEIEKIKKAAEIADSAFTDVLKFIRPGMGESDAAAEIEYHMRKHGASGPSFETIVASGERSALPHGVASGKAINHGEPVIFDFGACYDDYCSDMTRTVFIGKPDKQLKKIYDVVLKSQIAALKSLSPGRKGSRVDAVAREMISRCGFGDNFGHGLGHGVGLEIHEEPRLSPMGEATLKNGMVVTVEPGIYVTGLGGVRIEDLAVVNGESPIILTKSRKDLIII